MGFWTLSPGEELTAFAGPPGHYGPDASAPCVAAHGEGLMERRTRGRRHRQRLRCWADHLVLLPTHPCEEDEGGQV